MQLDDGYAIFEVSVPEEWDGKTIGGMDIRRKYNVNIMAVKREGKLNPNISSQTMLSGKDVLLVLGSHKDIQKCFHI